MKNRKLLFIVFTNDPCKRNHAFMHALELTENGHTVRIIIEGDATRCLAERTGHFGELFDAAVQKNIVAGVCETASGGCASDDPERDMTHFAVEQKVPLLAENAGHAGVSSYVAEGFELVIY